VRRQKSSQIAVGDTDDATMTMCDQVAVFDPPADRTGGDVETFCHLSDREKLGLIVAMAASVGGHAGPPSADRAGRAAGSKKDWRYANFARAWHLLARESVIYCCLGIVDRASDIGNAVYEFALRDVF
jgi:hypothetical protein